jgi:hypothetical protein
MPSGAALSIALLFPSLIGAAGAAPDAAPPRVRLDVRAPECISRSDLAARVGARSPRIQFADDAPISAEVAVRSQRAGNVTAELVLTTAGTEPSPRRVVARSCAEAADAIALIIAVTLDPTEARKREGGEGGASASPEASAGEPPPAPSGGNVVPKPAVVPAGPPVAAAPPTPSPSVQAVVPSPPAPSPTTKRQFGLSAAGQTIFGPAPAVLPGVALYATAALDRDGLWAPALLVGVTHVWRAGLDQPGGKASFTLDAASLDACPLRLRWWRLVTRPCASALVGRLSASGSETDQAASSARPFATAGAAVTAGIGSPVELALRLGLGVTLIRDSYEFAATPFHRAGRITTSLSLGIGVRWP